jgi:hypothetical protein
MGLFSIIHEVEGIIIWRGDSEGRVFYNSVTYEVEGIILEGGEGIVS